MTVTTVIGMGSKLGDYLVLQRLVALSRFMTLWVRRSEVSLLLLTFPSALRQVALIRRTPSIQLLPFSLPSCRGTRAHPLG